MFFVQIVESIVAKAVRKSSPDENSFKRTPSENTLRKTRHALRNIKKSQVVTTFKGVGFKLLQFEKMPNAILATLLGICTESK